MFVLICKLSSGIYVAAIHACVFNWHQVCHDMMKVSQKFEPAKVKFNQIVGTPIFVFAPLNMYDVLIKG